MSLKSMFKKNIGYCLASFFTIISILFLLRYEHSGYTVASVIEYIIPLVTRVIFGAIMLIYFGKYRKLALVTIFINATASFMLNLWEFGDGVILSIFSVETFILSAPFLALMIYMIMDIFKDNNKLVYAAIFFLAFLSALYSGFTFVGVVKSIVRFMEDDMIKEYIVPALFYHMSDMVFWAGVFIYGCIGLEKKEG